MQNWAEDERNRVCRELEVGCRNLDARLAAIVGLAPDESGSARQLAQFWQARGCGRLPQNAPETKDFSPAAEAGFGAMLAAALCDALKKTEPFVFNAGFDRVCWEKDVRRTYGTLADEVLARQAAAGLYCGGRLPGIQEKWPQIAALLQKVPDCEAVSQKLRAVGLRPEDFWHTHSHEQVMKAIVFAKDLHSGYTLLWLLRDTGLLEPFAKRIIIEYATE